MKYFEQYFTFYSKINKNINKKVYKPCIIGYNVSWYENKFQVGVKNNGNEY